MKLEPDVPAVAVTAVGDKTRLKSGAGLIVRVSGVAWLRDPAFPVAMTV
jgi:hypothetical protein